MIAGGHVFLSRSLAIARSLFHIHCVGLGCAPFSSAHSFVVPSGEGGGDDGVAVLRFAPRPVLRPVFSFRLYVHCSLFIRVVASRRRRFSSIQSSPLASLRRTLRSLPRCLIRFAHPSRPSSRLASRRPVSFHAVSLCLSVLIPSRLARCAERLATRLAVAPFYPAHLVVIPMLCRPCRPCRLMPG